MTAPSVPTCMPSSIQASYSLPVGVLRRSIRGARSRNLGSMRPVYISGGSTIWESAEINLYSAMTDLLRLSPTAHGLLQQVDGRGRQAASQAAACGSHISPETLGPLQSKNRRAPRPSAESSGFSRMAATE